MEDRMTAGTDPVALFGALWAEARRHAPENVADAMALATVGPQGRPSARMVLLRGADERGFVYFTNLESRKGREALAQPDVALLFHWPALKVQVRIEGTAALVASEEADVYFATRPRGSQLGAWCSDQSRPLRSRFELLRRYVGFKWRFRGGTVPRPPHWSGFRVAPRSIEFWFDRVSRLHVRGVYERAADGWRFTLLNP
jgi:pyridoxamine 5'-phosphate oxidase